MPNFSLARRDMLAGGAGALLAGPGALLPSAAAAQQTPDLPSPYALAGYALARELAALGTAQADPWLILAATRLRGPAHAETVAQHPMGFGALSPGQMGALGTAAAGVVRLQLQLAPHQEMVQPVAPPAGQMPFGRLRIYVHVQDPHSQQPVLELAAEVGGVLHERRWFQLNCTLDHTLDPQHRLVLRLRNLLPMPVLGSVFISGVA